VAIFAIIGGIVFFAAREVKPLSSCSVHELIELLRRPGNRVPEKCSEMIIVPGGEILEFSDPLRELMKRGSEARGPLLALLDDPEIQNEVVLALGAIGDEATVPELIARYPRGPVADGDKAAKLRRVCFSFALSWLTSEQIDRSRRGTDLSPGNAEKWEKWWAANRATFRVPAAKANATWVPSYPVEVGGGNFARPGFHF
jgi:hypothetical protein